MIQILLLNYSESGSWLKAATSDLKETYAMILKSSPTSIDWNKLSLNIQLGVNDMSRKYQEQTP